MEFAWVKATHLDFSIALQQGHEYTVRIPKHMASTVEWRKVVEVAIYQHILDHPRQASCMVGVRIVGVIALATQGRARSAVIPAESMVQSPRAKLLPLHSLRFAAVLHGPIYRLSNSDVGKFLSPYLLSAASMRTLTLVSKSFKRIFSSDRIWQHIPFPAKLWMGIGSQGTDQEVWNRLKQQQGITIAGSYR